MISNRPQVQMYVVAPCPHHYLWQAWGLVLRRREHLLRLGGLTARKGEACCEVQAILHGLSRLKRPCRVDVFMAAGESGGLPAPAWQQLQRPGSLDGHELHFLHASMSHPDMCVARAAACETAERARMVLDVFSEEDAVENSKVIVLPVRSRSASSALQGSAEVIDLFSGQSI